VAVSWSCSTAVVLQPKENPAVPADACDLAGNCGEGLVGPSLVFKIVAANGDRMLGPLPLPDQTGPGDWQALAPPLGFLAWFAVVLLSQHRKPLDGFLFQAAVGQFLDAISQSALQKAPVIRGRFGVE
jgi:hypothetical protein